MHVLLRNPRINRICQHHSRRHNLRLRWCHSKVLSFICVGNMFSRSWIFFRVPHSSRHNLPCLFAFLSGWFCCFAFAITSVRLIKNLMTFIGQRTATKIFKIGFSPGDKKANRKRGKLELNECSQLVTEPKERNARHRHYLRSLLSTYISFCFFAVIGILRARGWSAFHALTTHPFSRRRRLLFLI